jgi:hypothetical protein
MSTNSMRPLPLSSLRSASTSGLRSGHWPSYRYAIAALGVVGVGDGLREAALHTARRLGERRRAYVQVGAAAGGAGGGGGALLASVAGLGLGVAQHAHLRRAHGGAFRCEEVVGTRSCLNAGRPARAPRRSCTINFEWQASLELADQCARRGQCR